jgi:hypothetical protein
MSLRKAINAKSRECICDPPNASTAAQVSTERPVIWPKWPPPERRCDFWARDIRPGLITESERVEDEGR